MTAARYVPAVEARVEELRKIVHDLHYTKATREQALRELRPLERELGWGETYPGGYNRGTSA